MVLAMGVRCDDSSMDVPPDEQWMSMTDYYPSWSAATGLIAFIHSRVPGSDDPDSSGIYVIAPDGTQKTLLYEYTYLYSVDWSPDGQWLLVNANRRLVRIQFPGGAVDTLTGAGEYWRAVLSPDGSSLAYGNHSGDSMGIYTMPVGGGQAQHIIPTGTSVDWPYPDSLLHITWHEGFPSGAVIMSDTSGNPVRTVWSPGDNFMPFTAEPRMHRASRRIVIRVQEEDQRQSIWKIEPGQSRASKLCSYAETTEFSPDGNQIVFTDIHVGNGRLWIINWDGSGLRQLTHYTAFTSG